MKGFDPIPATLEQVADTAKVMSLTEEQRYLLCDLGYYNEVIRGYLILAMQGAGFEGADIGKALNCLSGALDDCTAKEARQAYQKFGY